MSLSRSGWVLKYLPHTSFLFCTQNCSNLQSNLLCGIWVLYVLQDSTIMAMYLSHKLQLRIRPHPITYPSTGRVYRFIALFIRFSHTYNCHTYLLLPFGFLYNKCYLEVCNSHQACLCTVSHLLRERLQCGNEKLAKQGILQFQGLCPLVAAKLGGNRPPGGPPPVFTQVVY